MNITTRMQRVRFFGSLLRAAPWLAEIGEGFEAWTFDFACGCRAWSGYFSGEVGWRKICPRHARVRRRMQAAA